MNKLPPPLFATPPLIAISACLRGAAVRYDGRDKFSTAIDSLSRQVQWLPLCPEQAAGLGVPRPPVQLVADGGAIAVRGRDNPALEVGETLQQTAITLAVQLDQQPVSGYIWQSRSPSCGLGSAPLHDGDGAVIGHTDGIQAGVIGQRLPWLIQAEDTALTDDRACQGFLRACQVINDVQQARWQQREADLYDHYRAVLGTDADWHREAFQHAPRALLLRYHQLAFAGVAR